MILLLDNTESVRADTLREMLYFIGIISQRTSSIRDLPFPASAFSAVVILCPLTAGELLEIKKIYGKNRIFCFGNVIADDEITKLKEGTFASELIYEIRSVQGRAGQKPVGEYRIKELDASVTRDGVYFEGRKISFTKTEIMILRSLIALYPRPLTQGELLNAAFRGARTPEISNIRTHICVMNKKFRALTAKRLISQAELSEYSLIL